MSKVTQMLFSFYTVLKFSAPDTSQMSKSLLPVVVPWAQSQGWTLTEQKSTGHLPSQTTLWPAEDWKGCPFWAGVDCQQSLIYRQLMVSLEQAKKPRGTWQRGGPCPHSSLLAKWHLAPITWISLNSTDKRLLYMLTV